MASYNGEKYIAGQLSSVLKQLKSTDEVIISDDGSSDRTLEIIRSFGDDRITVINNSLEHGYSKNFENALRHSTGDYIFICDQDDVWMDDKVRLVCEALKCHDLIIHDCSVTDKDLNVKFESFFDQYDIRQGFLRTLAYTRYTGACMAMKRSFLDYALPFPDNQPLCPYDYWFAYLGEYYRKAYLLRIPLMYYRRHENTALHAGEYSTRSFKEKAATRIYCIAEMIRRHRERQGLL